MTLTAVTSQPIDPTGAATLELFTENDDYSEFLWERLCNASPRELTGRILEAGCGTGNLTRILLRSEKVSFLHAIDMDPAYVRRVEEQVVDSRLQVTASPAEDFCPAEYQSPEGAFDAIVSSNVLEHIEDHTSVMHNFRRMLRPGGVALILVPAHPFLYCDLDRNLSHFRRYRRQDFLDLAQETGLEVLRLRHFNPLGTVGWWLNGKVLRRSVLPAKQLACYTRFAIPVSRWLDRINPFPLGISLLAAFGRR